MTTPVRVPLLSLRTVSKSYGAVRALVGVDLEVFAHEVVAIVGDNGAGKSTLVEVMAGVLEPDSGEVHIGGVPAVLTSPAAARTLGIATVFQDLALCENLDVVENLFLGNELYRHGLLDEVTMEKRAWELVGQLGARVPSVRVPVASLSGGQRQAVAVARSLIGEPRVVILDEPTAALGVAQTAEVLNLIERLRERGLGVVLVSHNLTDVHAVADRIAVLRLGRAVGVFEARETRHEDLFAAVTGARGTGLLRPHEPIPAAGPRTQATPTATAAPTPSTAPSAPTRVTAPETHTGSAT